jgi:IS30 family transposase
MPCLSAKDRRLLKARRAGPLGGRPDRRVHVATLVERHSRYVMLVKVANKDTESVVSALIKQSQSVPSELYFIGR